MDKKNWIRKLTDEDILAIHRAAICFDTKSVEVDRDTEDYELLVTAYENWPYEDGTPCYVPTEYRYYDTKHECHDSSPGNMGLYRQELAKRFGKEYLLDLISRLTEMNKKFLEEVLK